MCGLLAGSGKLDHKALCVLGVLNADRGSDSAGIGWWDFKANQPDFLKIAGHPHVAFPKSLSDGLVKAAASGVAIGHTRQATHGKVNSDNAHPFMYKGRVFAHNGIIFNHADFGKFEVDSESLIFGIKSRDFSKYEGPVALVWIEDGKLYAYRKGNPLYRGSKAGAVYLASDDDYLKAIECIRIKPLSEGHLYVFKKDVVESVRRIPANQPGWTHYTSTSEFGYSGYQGYTHKKYDFDKSELVDVSKEKPEEKPKEEPKKSPVARPESKKWEGILKNRGWRKIGFESPGGPRYSYHRPECTCWNCRAIHPEGCACLSCIPKGSAKEKLLIESGRIAPVTLCGMCQTHPMGGRLDMCDSCAEDLAKDFPHIGR